MYKEYEPEMRANRHQRAADFGSANQPKLMRYSLRWTVMKNP
jgi:hypothetical protein